MNRREFNRNVLAAAGGMALSGFSWAAAEDSRRDLRESDQPDSSMHGGLTDVEGLKVGHFTEKRRPTGCTVVLCEKGAVAGVDVRGGAPGTRETDLLNPINMVQQVYAIVLSGGSAFGLDTASGVMRYLDERGIGFRLGPQVVPIVPAAILFDLTVGDGKIRPTAESGYQACVAATSQKVAEGNVGAGAGATVGKLFGPQFAMKGGLGTASIRAGDTGLVVAALAAVNAAGDVYEPGTEKILAGARSLDGEGFANTMNKILSGYGALLPAAPPSNSTIGVVATNAPLNKDEATKMAQMAHDGLARTINPVHTPFDGDTIFALATGTFKAKVSVGAVGAIAAVAMVQAIVRAITQAEGVLGIPGYRDLQGKPR
ncbi:MAG: P1 family peptidase [Candidatus Acidiferrales bacterium]